MIRMTEKHLMELEKAFNAVANKADWKAPIKATIPADQIAITGEAIVHYTATEATFTPTDDTNFVLVESIGYRAGPAGDH